MLCIFFRKGANKCPLKKHMEKLMNIHDDPKQNPINRRKSLFDLIVIVKAISYAANCPKNEFVRIKGDNEAFWSTKNFKVLDPYTNKILGVKNIELIKNIGKDNRPDIKRAPIFEIRVNRIEDLDIGFRCVFFVTHNYECYVSPFKKDKYRGHNNEHTDYRAQQQGKHRTNNAACTTYNVYKSYKLNPEEFSSLFNNNNLIKNFFKRGVKNEESH